MSNTGIDAAGDYDFEVTQQVLTQEQIEANRLALLQKLYTKFKSKAADYVLRNPSILGPKFRDYALSAISFLKRTNRQLTIEGEELYTLLEGSSLRYMDTGIDNPDRKDDRKDAMAELNTFLNNFLKTEIEG